MRRQADRREWERDVERKARTLIASSRFDEAQRIIHERPVSEWTDNSPLWLIDVDLWLLKKDGAAQAGQVIRTALDRLKNTDDPDLALSLLLRRVSAEERMEDRTSAYKWAVESLAMARSLRNPVSIFACGVALLRLARQTNRLDDPEMGRLRTELVGLSKDDAVVRALPERPSLIREAAAELGAFAPDLLSLALERLGLEVGSEGLFVPSLTDELLAIIDEAGDRPAYDRAERGSTLRVGRTASVALANAIRRGPVGIESLRVLSALYAASVDRLSRQTFA